MRAAHAELADAIKAIQQVPGFEEFLAPVRFADVAATAGHPLVYLVPSEQSGLGLIVRDGAVADVRLPALTDRDVTHWAEQVARDGWTRHLAGLTGWLWEAIGGPLLEALPGTPRITLVPGGLTGLLPVHAARCADATRPTGFRYLIDEVVPGYTPNARALAAARTQAARVTPRRLLAIADADLPNARWEIQAAAAAFPESEIEFGDKATIDFVRTALPAADIAHFGCHGVVDVEPLQNAIRLAGGASLRLADILPMRLRLRLAVLSACDSFVPGRALPDEVINLPTGLLQAGVAGVVASMWAIPDHATALLMTEFYRRWQPAEDPAGALAGAQCWLRDATPADIEEHWSAALEAGETWLPEEVAAALLPGVFTAGESGSRPWSEPATWAAFTFTGA
jgi:CHAT domain-containing protein